MSWRACLYLLIVLNTKGLLRAATYNYDYTDRCSKAYLYFMSLHMQEGHNILEEEKKANTQGLMATYISDYEDYIVLLLNCDRHEFDLRSSHMDDRLAMLERGDPSSPWFRLCKAGIYLHWAVIHLRFGEQYRAALYFHRSFSLLKENRNLFPSFEYNNVFAGLQEAVVGSLPGNLKWLAAVFGMKGNMKGGIARLNDFMIAHNEKQPLYAETILYYAYTRFYLLNEQKEVWDLLSGPLFSTDNNLLNTFAKVNIAIDYRKADYVIETLKAAASQPQYSSYPVFDYQLGVALLSRLDTSCNYYFRRYLAANKSMFFIKDTWQKMALANYISGNTIQAEVCLSKVISEGEAHTDADKQAKRFAENNSWPVKEVLQARLLIEGGYYNRALSLLTSLDPSKMSVPGRLEYFFRMGKAYQELGNDNKALTNYQFAINEGRLRHEQFAARAALQMGLIYERCNMKEEARKRYNQCLDMPSHDFQNSIDHQAKAGLDRLDSN